MSTKGSLSYCVDEATGMTAHLYEDCLASDNAPVYLELTAVPEVSLDTTSRGIDVTIAIPRGLAEKLNLLPKRA